MEAAECTLNVSKTCRDPDGSLNVVQDPQAVIAGMQRLCDVRDREFLAGWFASWLAGWFAGWLVCLLAGCLAG